jgi:histone H3
VREITQDFKMDVRWTEKALILLQYSLENYIVSLIKEAYKITTASKRLTLEPKDLELARRILKDRMKY